MRVFADQVTFCGKRYLPVIPIIISIRLTDSVVYICSKTFVLKLLDFSDGLIKLCFSDTLMLGYQGMCD